MKQVPVQVLQEFEVRFGGAPDGVVWAPGRVNLIGEHTDYSQLPVLPMAIDHGLRIAYRAGGERLVARSIAFEGSADWPLGGLSELTAESLPPWHRYLLGAARAAGPLGVGGELLIDGDLPVVGGLSSSSALTLGLLQVLAVLDAEAQSPGLAALVERAVVAERIVGVESGGMDQNVIAHARAGHALRIDFSPTRHRAVRLPEAWCWVAASSGVEAPKGGRVRAHYNERVLGTRLAAALLGEHLGRAETRWLSGFADDEGRRAVERLPESASADAVAERLGIARSRLDAATSGGRLADGEVSVREVARHVLEEAARVDRTEAALAAGDLAEVGELLDQSHRSLQRFGASTPELDALCDALRAAGAAGARLTGAGFGGFALAVAPSDRADDLLAAALDCTGGPAFVARPSDGLRVGAVG